MFVTPAFAQAAPGAPSIIETLLPFALVFVILYFFLIRPQQRRAKHHREMLAALRRGDTVVTTGGVIGKVVRVEDQEVQVEVADGVRLRILRSAISELRSKTEPAPAEVQNPAKPKEGKDGAKTGPKSGPKDE
jgi:preprotein translocase subunit YajC